MHKIKLVLFVAALAVISGGCLPNNATTKTSSSAMETEARVSINSILFDQRTYYIENQKFATSIGNLRTMNPKMESPSYTYAIKAKPGIRNSVAVTATPKSANLRSFTGVVFAVKAGKEKLTISEICETTKPSKQAPTPPPAPKRPSEQIRCPVGSRSSSSVLALQ